jgi:hypothetical protein
LRRWGSTWRSTCCPLSLYSLLCSSSSFSTRRRVSGLGAGGRRCGKKRSKEEKEEEKISTFSVGFLLI